MVTCSVKIIFSKWSRRGHCGVTEETEYNVFLNQALLATFDTHGSMQTGYWQDAKKSATEYAEKVAGVLGVEVEWQERSN